MPRKSTRKTRKSAGRHQRAEPKRRQRRPRDGQPAQPPTEARQDEQGAGPAARSMWSGTISFGLVSVPVAIYPAMAGGRTTMRMLDEDGTPLARRYWCPNHQRDIERDHIVRGYEVGPDQYVVITDDELESLEPERSRDIDLRLFVDIEDIDPIRLDRPYFLVPTGGANKAYRLLARTMEETGKAGIATFVMRDREYLVAIVAEHGLLRAQTMRFNEEIRTAEQVGLPAPEPAPGEEVDRFRAAISKLTRDTFDPASLRNEYEAKLSELVQRKANADRDIIETEEAPAEAGEATVYNLMAALEQTIQAAQRPRRRRSA